MPAMKWPMDLRPSAQSGALGLGLALGQDGAWVSG